MKKDEQVEIGDEARDMITGYQGIVVAQAKHLTGCDRFTIQAPAEDGKIPDAYGFDVTTVKLIRKHAVKPIGRELETQPAPEKKLGGPASRAPRW